MTDYTALARELILASGGDLKRLDEAASVIEASVTSAQQPMQPDIIVELDRLRLKAFASNSDADRAAYFDRVSRAYQRGELVAAIPAQCSCARAGFPGSCDNCDDTSDPRWNTGCDFAMTQLCKFLGVDPNSISWDAATETVDGDVQAVIGNILRAKFGEDWGPDDNSHDPLTMVPGGVTSAGSQGPCSGMQGRLPRDANASELTEGERGNGWRCFHCDEVFTDRKLAEDHFGFTTLLAPACVDPLRGNERAMNERAMDYERLWLKALQERDDALRKARRPTALPSTGLCSPSSDQGGAA